MNCLQIVRSVCGRIGLGAPNALVGSTDLQAAQLRELLVEEGMALAGRSASGWQALLREATFTTAAQEDQGSLATIMGAANAYRAIVEDTIWNRTTQEAIYGPNTPQGWQRRKASIDLGPYPQFRIRGNRLLLYPVPTAGNACYFEYASRNWLISEGGIAYRQSIEADTDIPLLPEDLLMMGLKWRWHKSKGLDYSQDFDDYEALVADALARDTPKGTKSLSGENYLPGIPVAINRLIGSS